MFQVAHGGLAKSLDLGIDADPSHVGAIAQKRRPRHVVCLDLGEDGSRGNRQRIIRAEARQGVEHGGDVQGGAGHGTVHLPGVVGDRNRNGRHAAGRRAQGPPRKGSRNAQATSRSVPSASQIIREAKPAAPPQSSRRGNSRGSGVARCPEQGVERTRAGCELRVLVLPITIAPACFRRATVITSLSSTKSLNSGEP